MKLGQFMCLGNLQRLKNRFGNGYAVQVKIPIGNVQKFKDEMISSLPGVQIIGKDRIISRSMLHHYSICRGT